MCGRVRVAGVSLSVVVAALLGAGPARSGDTSPAIVIPGRAGVPVMMYGRDISGAVIEGDWGLARAGAVEPTVIFPQGPRVIYGTGGGYYPATGEAPAYGRREVIPPANRRLPPPAENYYRSWRAESDPVPASPPAANPPTVIVAPPFSDERRRPVPRYGESAPRRGP